MSTPGRDALAGSRLYTGLSRALDRSTVATRLRSLDEAVDAAVEESRVASLAAYGSAVVRDSSPYRWLTTDPDPDVVVVDLRETYTVGPVVSLLEAVLDGPGSLSRSSALRRWAGVTWASVAPAIENARTTRYVAAVLAPPDPDREGDDPRT